MPVEPDEVEQPVYHGDNGNDVVYDTNVISRFYGYGGDDVFYVHATDAFPKGDGTYYHPDDYYYGGSGNDTISYLFSTNKVVANLSTGLINRIHDGVVQST